MKYAGKVGFVESVETPTGLWKEVVEERFMYGDVTSDTRRMDAASNVIPDYRVNAQFNLVADAYCYDHLAYIRYVTYRGVKWEVSSVVALNFPRISITIGNVYNGPEVEEDE